MVECKEKGNFLWEDGKLHKNSSFLSGLIHELSSREKYIQEFES